MEPMGISPEERAELLAWMLGEIDGEAARAVEARVRADGNWQRAKAEMERVMALVREAGPEVLGGSGDVLSDGELLRVAGRVASRRRGLSRPLLAAALVLVLGGLTWLQWSGWRIEREPAPGAADFQVAAAIEPAETAEGAGREVGRALGYALGGGGEAPPPEAGPVQVAAADPRAAEEPGGEALRLRIEGEVAQATRPLGPPAPASQGTLGPAAGLLGQGPSTSGPATGAFVQERLSAERSQDFFLGQGGGSLEGLSPGKAGPVPPAPGPSPDLFPAGAELERRDGGGQRRVAEWLAWCRPLPGEGAFSYFLRQFGSRPFERTATKPLATFAASVDTASYTHARAYLRRAQLPPEELVRTEAFVNRFRDLYGDLGPAEGTFALHLEVAPSPFADPDRGAFLLRAAVVARDVAPEARSPLALTLVVDVSGSMAQGRRLEMVRDAMVHLVEQLDAQDRVAIVSYSNTAQVVVPMTSGHQKRALLEGLAGLRAGGGTNLEAGLVLGYQLAALQLDSERQHRVVLLSDGVGNIGATSVEGLLERVADFRGRGIYLNTVGVGMGDQNDALLDGLARRGDGVATYVDSDSEARRAFSRDLGRSLETVARDVKLQIELEPSRVGSWRLLGYESRALADRAFRDDTVDGGEVNSGHTVVALVELEQVDLRGEGPLATLRVRYHGPNGPKDEGLATELARTVSVGEASGHGSPRFHLSAAVAQVAELLRASPHRVGARTAPVVEALRKAAARSAESEGAHELLELALWLEPLSPALDQRARDAGAVSALVHRLAFAQWELTQELELPGEPDPARVALLRARVAEAEALLAESDR